MTRRLLTVVLCLASAAHVGAQTPQVGRLDTNCCPRLGCCDDYCRKPCPVIECIPRCGGPNNYDCKVQPCIVNIPRFCGVDDYCRKPLPCLLCPPYSPYLQCGSCPPSGLTEIHR